MKSNAGRATCTDCYFHQASLCALRLEEPCPTFRHHSRGSLTPPPQPRLLPRPLGQIAEQYLIAQHAAA
jgi:hypothetical protein